MSNYWIMKDGTVLFENPVEQDEDIPALSPQERLEAIEDSRRRHEEEQTRREAVKARQEAGRAKARQMGYIK